MPRKKFHRRIFALAVFILLNCATDLLSSHHLFAQTIEQYSVNATDSSTPHAFVYNIAQLNLLGKRIVPSLVVADENEKIRRAADQNPERFKQRNYLLGVAWTVPLADTLSFFARGTYRFSQGSFNSGEKDTANYRSLISGLNYSMLQTFSIGIGLRYVSFAGGQRAESDLRESVSGYFVGWGAAIHYLHNSGTACGFFHNPVMRGKLKKGYDRVLGSHAGLSGFECSYPYTNELFIGLSLRAALPASNRSDTKVVVLESDDISTNGIAALAGVERILNNGRSVKTSIGHIFPKTIGGQSEALSNEAKPQSLAKVAFMFNRFETNQSMIGIGTRISHQKMLSHEFASYFIHGEYQFR